eukprot:4253157-Pleurochrysis_carterae.AAC.3
MSSVVYSGPDLVSSQYVSPWMSPSTAPAHSSLLPYVVSLLTLVPGALLLSRSLPLALYALLTSLHPSISFSTDCKG